MGIRDALEAYVNFTNKIASYFTSKMNLFRNSQRNCNSRNASYGGLWANTENKGCFIEKRGAFGGAVLNESSLEESKSFRWQLLFIG